MTVGAVEVRRKGAAVQEARGDVDADAVGEHVAAREAAPVGLVAVGDIGIVGVKEIDEALRAAGLERILQITQNFRPIEGFHPDAENVACPVVLVGAHGARCLPVQRLSRARPRPLASTNPTLPHVPSRK